MDGADVVLAAGNRSIRGRRMDADFPDYRRIVREPGSSQVEVDVAGFREQLAAAPTRTVQSPEDGREHAATVLSLGYVEGGVNREFLLQALDAADAGQLVLDLDGPIAPLVLRAPGRDGDLSMLMPIKLD